MFTERFKQHFAAIRVYGGVAAKILVADRGILIADFLLATSIPFLVQFLIWRSVYSEQGTSLIHGTSHIQLIFYYAYAITLSRLNNGYDIIQHLSGSVLTGSMDLELIRPCPYPFQRLYDFIGGGLIYGLPVLLVMLVHLGFSLNEVNGLDHLLWQPVYLAGVLLQLLLSQILCFSVSFLMGLASFWLVKPDLLLSLITVITGFFGGALLPPTFWPTWLQPLMVYNPFRFMIAAPAEIMVHPGWNNLTQSLLGSAAFISVFALLITWAWKRVTMNYVSSGG